MPVILSYSALMYLVGDFNIRLDRPDDPQAVNFLSLLQVFDLDIAATGSTHVRGGTFDAVACAAKIAADVIDCGISDRHLLRWRSVAGRPQMTSSNTLPTECVQRGSCRSSTTMVVCGVLPGSVLGPVLFILDTANLSSLVVLHGLQPHLYADDTPVYGSCRADEFGSSINRLTKCVDDLAIWMRSNRLQINSGKTEYMWFTTPRRIQQLPAAR
jgi:Reverse transcriptase (RNA-dependent DNA polymerase)